MVTLVIAATALSDSRAANINGWLCRTNQPRPALSYGDIRKQGSHRVLSPLGRPTSQPAPTRSCVTSKRVSELTQYSTRRPSSTRRRSVPVKVTAVPGGAAAPGNPPW